MKCEKVSLFDLACWKNGLAFKNIQFAAKGKPIIKIAELKNGITTQTRFTEQVFDDNVSLKKGDMLFSWSGNPETSIDVYWYELPDGWLNQHIFKVTPKGFVDKFYLYYLLKSFKKVFTNIASNKQTTGLGHVTVKDLKEIFVNLPDLSYQRLIGEYLNKIDEKIRINNRINDNLEKQVEAIYQSLFVYFNDIPENQFKISELGPIPIGWKVKHLSEVTTSIRTKVKHNNYKVLSAINTGQLQLSEEYFTKQVFSKNLSNYIAVEPFDFAYNPARINIGSIGMNTFSFTGCVSPVYVVVRAEPEYYYFLNFFIKSKRF